MSLKASLKKKKCCRPLLLKCYYVYGSPGRQVKIQLLIWWVWSSSIFHGLWSDAEASELQLQNSETGRVLTDLAKKSSWSIRGYWLGMSRKFSWILFQKARKEAILFPPFLAMTTVLQRICSSHPLFYVHSVFCCLWCSSVIPLYKVLKGIYLELFYILNAILFYIF